ncbi:hypothetical protein Baya_12941 [Bagarius yarrelli]|uniref:Uncharacterized protein n=1 Tax=Bagarius yarrelli TaxID=175774 RepID=A0A556V4K2_BAGYA|nr:hypothetical protein Baya_12941 [Bagarius yarrelli]
MRSYTKVLVVAGGCALAFLGIQCVFGKRVQTRFLNFPPFDCRLGLEDVVAPPTLRDEKINLQQTIPREDGSEEKTKA